MGGPNTTNFISFGAKQQIYRYILKSTFIAYCEVLQKLEPIMGSNGPAEAEIWPNWHDAVHGTPMVT